MKYEIEHKFLVKSDGWRKNILRSSRIIQGYFSRAQGYVLRIRIIDDKALLTLKGGRSGANGLTRMEFEYEVPVDDAIQMLKNFCEDRIITKMRYFLDAGNGLTWEIDEYSGKCAGLYTAEIEIPDESTEFERPDWLGRDVSQYSRFGNRALAENGLPPDWNE